MSEQIHHKSDSEAPQSHQEVAAQPEERPLTGLYISRKGRDGAPDYMDGGWSVLGRQTVNGTEYTRVMQPTDARDQQGKPLFNVKDIPTDALYELHHAEVERIRTEQEAEAERIRDEQQLALGEGAVDVVSLEQQLEPVSENSGQDLDEELVAPSSAPEQENKRELSEEMREALKEKWSEAFAGVDTSEQMLEKYIKGMDGRGAPVNPAVMCQELQQWVPSQSFTELRADVMKTFSGNGDDAWLTTLANRLTRLGGVYPGLGHELPHQHRADDIIGYLHGASAQVQRLKHEIREALKPAVQTQESHKEF